MKFNKWTLGLAAVGAVSMASAVRADEAKLVPLNTALTGTTISGYVDVAAQYNPGQPSGEQSSTVVNQPTGLSADKVDAFSINSVTVTIEKALDDSAWASGYRIDLNGGADAFTPLETTGADFGIRQGYVALRTPVGNGIDWKMGLWDGVTGYEANTGYLNPNYTRSYGYFFNPASEAGLIGAYKVCDVLSVQAGIANRGELSNEGSGTEVGLSSKTYIATASLTAPDDFGFLKGSVLNLQTVQTLDNGGINNYSVNATLNTPVTGLKLGLVYDAVQALNGGDDCNIFGLYLCFQATDKLALNLRGEYIDNSAAAFGPYTPTGPNTPTGGNGNGYEVTATLQYDLWENVVSRIEARWDHTDSGRLYNYNLQANAYLLALNIVYKF
jgi:hypothetical protein